MWPMYQVPGFVFAFDTYCWFFFAPDYSARHPQFINNSSRPHHSHIMKISVKQTVLCDFGELWCFKARHSGFLPHHTDADFRWLQSTFSRLKVCHKHIEQLFWKPSLNPKTFVPRFCDGHDRCRVAVVLGERCRPCFQACRNKHLPPQRDSGRCAQGKNRSWCAATSASSRFGNHVLGVEGACVVSPALWCVLRVPPSFLPPHASF